MFPQVAGTGLDRRIGGVPLYFWIVGGAILSFIGYHFYRQQQLAKQQQQQQQSANPATQNPVSVDPNSAYVQGITDQSGNLLPQFSWPYNQLALPYNWGPGASSIYNYSSAQSPQFIGAAYTPTSGGL